MFHFLILWPIFIIIINPKFNNGINDPNSLKGRPWLDLNLLPHELPEPPIDSTDLAELSNPADESSNHDPDISLESLDESVPTDLTKQSDQSDVVKTKYLTIPRVDAEGKILSQEVLELIFLATLGRQRINLQSTLKGVLPDKLCTKIWIQLQGPPTFSCYARMHETGKSRTKVKLEIIHKKLFDADILSCQCRPRAMLTANMQGLFFMVPHSEKDYFILLRPKPKNGLQLAGYLPNI